MITDLLADQALTDLIVVVCLLTAADLITGISAAARAGKFRLELVGEFIQSHVVGRVLPITATAILGHYEAALFALAAAAAAAYTLETVGSIREALMLPAETPSRRLTHAQGQG